VCRARPNSPPHARVLLPRTTGVRGFRKVAHLFLTVLAPGCVHEVRRWCAVSRCMTLMWIFAPVAAASSLLPLLSRRPCFVEWYLALVVRTLERAGMCFIKLGQWLSMRSNMIDHSVSKALGALRDDGPCHEFHHTQRLLEHTFECPLETIFERLDEAPTASGSVAQVR
jgi:hypothetical protein